MKSIQFAETFGGTCTYSKWLYRTPIVATINLSTRSMPMLVEHDWLASPSNRVLLDLVAPPWIP